MSDLRTVPVAEWGKDHWSLLAYLEVRCVDNGGAIVIRHMRCNPRRHPMFAHAGTRIGLDPSAPYQYPSVLRKGADPVLEHDDWDCLEDLEAAGLIENRGTGINPRIYMTDAGLTFTAQIRACKAKGGSFATFEPTR